ncbi:trans-1,2-dihydrobenzene-1,2-diol dehydrogenase-like [Euwallacea similis]|uniref:trans-1,2-dihydrobenzene-1,2-diol dehydrogenase-like n=1 Tax=Euwallacea similis TaxID=1736056 RepID=UPI00344FC8B5
MALQWGIVSTGCIAHDFVSALKALPQDKHQIVAVAARSLSSAEKFAKTHEIPKAYEGYENIAKNPKVQVVYIGVLNPQHHEVATLMLQNGKHVLLEKPFTLNEKLTRRVLELAKSQNLFIMEAIWTRFFPVFQDVRQLLNSGALGEIRFASTTFGVTVGDVDRVKQKALGGSAVLDIGIYALQFQQFVFRGLKPEKIVTAGHLNEQEVDNAFSVIFTYPGHKTAVLSCDVTVDFPNEAIIVGTKGTVKISSPFWAPLSYTLNGEVKEKPIFKNERKFNFWNSAGLAYQAIEVRKSIFEGKTESSTVPHEETIQLAAWMDQIRKELGVVFSIDTL